MILLICCFVGKDKKIRISWIYYLFMLCASYYLILEEGGKEPFNTYDATQALVNTYIPGLMSSDFFGTTLFLVRATRNKGIKAFLLLVLAVTLYLLFLCAKIYIGNIPRF